MSDIGENNSSYLPIILALKNDKGSDYFISNQPKKVDFLRYFDESFPNLTTALDKIGIKRVTFLEALEKDTAFATEVKRIREKHTDKIVNMNYEVAQTKGGFMDRIAFLRYQETGSWNPESKMTMIHENISEKEAMGRASRLANIVDAELIEGIPKENMRIVKSLTNDVPSSPDETQPDK